MFKARFLAFLLLLSLIPISFTPVSLAAHLNWAETGTLELDAVQFGQNPGDGDFARLSPTTFLLAWVDAAAETFVYVCESDGCSSSATLYGSANVAQVGLYSVTSSLAFACSTDDGTDDTHVQRTTNGGTLWSTAAAMTSTIVDPGNCAVTSYDGSNVTVFASSTPAPDQIRTAYSTNGGQTWTGEGDLEAGAAVASSAVRAISFNDTSHSVLYVSSTNQVRECYTTVSATWTCRNVLGVSGVVGIDYIMSGGHGYACWADEGTDDVKFAYLSAPGDPWVTSTPSNLASNLEDGCGIAVFDSNSIGIVYPVTVDNADNGDVLYYTESVNGGGQWSTPELVLSADVTDTSSSSNTVVGLMYADAFDQAIAVVNYAADLDDTDTLTGPDNALWSISTSFAVGGVSATASVTNLVGFDVDPTGTRAVARTYGGDCVEVWGAKTLGNHAQCPVSGSIETNCDLGFKEDAVAAKYGGELVMFLNCETDGDVQYLSIRDPGGSVPTASEFNDCTPGSAAGQCPYDITITEAGWGQFDDVGQLGQIKDFPVDYSNRDGDPGGIFLARLAWAFTTQDPDPGEVGVAHFVRAEPASPDVAEEDAVGFSATVAEDFCIGLDDDQYYLAAADSAESVKTWPVSFSGTLQTPSIGGAEPFGVSGATGIDCGGGQVAFVSGTTLYYATRAGVILDTYALADSAVRGVAISEEYELDGDTCFDAPTDATCKQVVLAYKDDTDVILVFTTNLGDLVLAGSLEVTVDGSFKELEVDHHANGAWLAQTGQVDYYEIFNLTNSGEQVPSQCVVDCEGNGFDPDGDGLFGGSGATIGAAFGVGAFGGNLFLGALLMGIVAYGVGTGYGNVIDSNTMQPRFLRVNPWAAAIGAAIGFLVAWGFGFFSTAAVFSLIALVAMIVGIKLWVSRG